MFSKGIALLADVVLLEQVVIFILQLAQSALSLRPARSANTVSATVGGGGGAGNYLWF